MNFIGRRSELSLFGLIVEYKPDEKKILVIDEFPYLTPYITTLIELGLIEKQVISFYPFLVQICISVQGRA